MRSLPTTSGRVVAGAFFILLGSGCIKGDDRADHGDSDADANTPGAGGPGPDDAKDRDQPVASGDGDGAGSPDGNGDSGDGSPADDLAGQVPGTRVADPGATGSDACDAITLQDLIDTVHEQEPGLSDISLIHDPGADLIGDGSFIYAFARDDGGFSLVFKRGMGDCPSGCIDNEYWYFDTDDVCEPEPVGHYHPSHSDDGCIEQDGLPMFGLPPAPDPVRVCGTDLTPAALNGRYRFTTTGDRTPCSTKEAQSQPQALEVTIEIAQDASEPTTGTVLLKGTGHPYLDDQLFDASFVLERFRVEIAEDNLPAICLEQHELVIEYDFAAPSTSSAGRIDLFEVLTPDCDGAPGDYCKGALNLTLQLIE